jgi:hypothetical protein
MSPERDIGFPGGNFSADDHILYVSLKVLRKGLNLAGPQHYAIDYLA